MLTFLPLEQIDEMDKWEGAELNKAKEILAYELTNLVHGEEEAKKAQDAARALFGGGPDAEIPTTALHDGDFENDEIGIIQVLVAAGLVTSNGEARRAIQQNGVAVNNTNVTDPFMKLSKAELAEGSTIVRRGKKNFRKIIVE